MRRLTPVTLLCLSALTAALHGEEGYRLPPPAKAASQPIECVGNRDVVLANRFIRTGGHGVDIRGNCDVRIIDSHIVAGGAGILVHANADVEVIDSFVQGAAGAVDLEGNGSVSYRGSTLRGGTRARGNGDLIDAGANTFERIPGGTSGALTRGEVVSCRERERLTVSNRLIESESDAVTVEGDCEVFVSDSHIVARGAAIRVAGKGSVRLRNSTLEGEAAAVRIEDEGVVDAAGSSFFGEIHRASAESRFVDGGGNSADGEAAAGLPPSGGERVSPRTSGDAGGGTTAGHGESSPGARISIGPGGVRIQGRGDSEGAGSSVEVGPGGVEIRSSERSGQRQRIESCADLCDLWPALTSGQAECAAVVLEIRGFEVYDHLVCIEVETRSRCAACARVLDLQDKDCLAIVDRCIPRRR